MAKVEASARYQGVACGCIANVRIERNYAILIELAAAVDGGGEVDASVAPEVAQVVAVEGMWQLYSQYQVKSDDVLYHIEIEHPETV